MLVLVSFVNFFSDVPDLALLRLVEICHQIELKLRNLSIIRGPKLTKTEWFSDRILGRSCAH